MLRAALPLVSAMLLFSPAATAQAEYDTVENAELKIKIKIHRKLQAIPMKVGDINQTQANIHGGVKYVRWVIDHYFKDQPMDDVNRMLFAFASYNAGPGRVRGLRKEAEKRGLDPNLWFHNVEHVAAEKIGRETVQYVANIYKYYIAYQMVEEQAAARRKARAEARGKS